MFEEAQLYSPVTTRRRRRASPSTSATTTPASTTRPTASGATRSRPPPSNGSRASPIPQIDYTDAEQEVWRTVCRELAPKHERYACRAFRDAVVALDLPRDRIPQLDEVTAGLRPLTGFEYVPAAGIVPLDEFYGSLADRRFHSTQYVRHHDAPLYTPEPDLIHEVIGHGHLLADPQMAELQPARRARPRGAPETAEALQMVADVFWFTIEFGVAARGRRAARLRRRDPLLLRRDRGVPRDGDPPARLRGRWRRSTTTSPSTSRSSSAPSRWATWSTRSASSSRAATTTPPRASESRRRPCPPPSA